MENTKALIGAGCFWGIEEFFRNLIGVTSTTVGYAGGNFHNPSYEQVCTGTTGHAEVVLINYEIEKISYSQLLDNFWTCHDPTQFNRQGFDIGSQYRSIIIYFSDDQKNIAENSKKNFEDKKSVIVATEIIKYEHFYKAESYHQCYLQKKLNHI